MGLGKPGRLRVDQPTITGELGPAPDAYTHYSRVMIAGLSKTAGRSAFDEGGPFFCMARRNQLDADMELGAVQYGSELAPTLALRFRVDSVTHFSKLFRPFQEPPFSALPLFVRSRWIEKPVQLRGSQAESLRSSFWGSRLGWLRYCERLLE